MALSAHPRSMTWTVGRIRGGDRTRRAQDGPNSAPTGTAPPTASGAPPVPVLNSGFVGAWRSLVAHQSGGLVVVGSNPAAPTNIPREMALRGRSAPKVCSNSGSNRADVPRRARRDVLACAPAPSPSLAAGPYLYERLAPGRVRGEPGPTHEPRARSECRPWATERRLTSPGHRLTVRWSGSPDGRCRF